MEMGVVSEFLGENRKTHSIHWDKSSDSHDWIHLGDVALFQK